MPPKNRGLQAKGRRVGTGPRGVRNALAPAMIAAAPDLMREILAQPEEVRAYCAALIRDRDDPDCTGHRGAMRLIPEILGAVGAPDSIVNALIVTLGAPIERAREAVEMVNAVSDDPHEIARSCRAFLAWYGGPSGPGSEVPAADVVESRNGNGRGE